MRILPITNNRITQNPSFFGKSNPEKAVEKAQKLLDNYENITKEDFKNGAIHKKLALLYFDLDYSKKNNYEQWMTDSKKMDQLYEKNKQNYKNLYIHALVDLGLKVEELRLDVAINEAMKKKNEPLLKLMKEDMKLRPILQDGCIIEDYMLDYYIHYNDTPFVQSTKINIYGKYIPPVKDLSIENSNLKKAALEEAKEMIRNDEETTGQVSLKTILKIVSNPDFPKIKDENLNIAGSKILHLLAETCFNPEDENDVKIVKDIINKCENANYNFNTKNRFDETAEDKAIEAENSFLAKLISERTYNDNSKD